jgi:hypothetical protein
MSKTQELNEEEVRTLFFNRKKKIINFEGSLPGLEMLDGNLALQELTGAAARHAKLLATTKDGEDPILLGAASIIKSLILRKSGNRIFKDTDIQGVCDFGLSVINPIGEQIQALSGATPQAVQEAKDDFLQTDNSVSDSSFTGN